jgi:hypothetical protein
MGSGTSYGLIKEGTYKVEDVKNVLCVEVFPTSLHDSRGSQHNLIETSNQVASYSVIHIIHPPFWWPSFLRTVYH